MFFGVESERGKGEEGPPDLRESERRGTGEGRWGKRWEEKRSGEGEEQRRGRRWFTERGEWRRPVGEMVSG